MRWTLFLLAVSLSTAAVPAQEGRPASPPETIAATKLVYLSGNFMHAAEVDRCAKVMKEAAAAGYTGVVVTDCKFDRWEETVTVRRPQYEANVRKLSRRRGATNFNSLPACAARARISWLMTRTWPRGCRSTRPPFSSREAGSCLPIT